LFIDSLFLRPSAARDVQMRSAVWGVGLTADVLSLSGLGLSGGLGYFRGTDEAPARAALASDSEQTFPPSIWGIGGTAEVGYRARLTPNRDYPHVDFNVGGSLRPIYRRFSGCDSCVVEEVGLDIVTPHLAARGGYVFRSFDFQLGYRFTPVSETQNHALFLSVLFEIPESRQDRTARADCDLGSSPACERLAEQSDHRNDAFDYYEQACNHLSGSGCLEAGKRAGGSTKAEGLFGKSCDLGHAPGCAALAELLGPGAPGAAANEKACALGLAASCTQAAASKQEPALLRQGCALGDGEACAELARLTKDPVEAAADFERGCRERDGDACAALGHAYKDGHGVKADPARSRKLLAQAIELLRYACQNGDRPACGRRKRLETELDRPATSPSTPGGHD
jgi:hypothetical protein